MVSSGTADENRAASAEEHGFYAPIARFGFAVAARVTVPGTGPRRFLLRANAGEPAVKAISARRYEFEDAVKKKVERTGWSVVRFGTSGDLSDFTVDTRLGAVFDFTEFVIRNDELDIELVMRFCVTVCNKKDAEAHGSASDADLGDDVLYVWQDDKRHELPQHSKIWVRFGCLKFRSRTNFSGMSSRDMRLFFDQSEQLAVEINQAILHPYKEVLREILVDQPELGGAPLHISTVFKIKSFTASVEDETFPIAYRKLLLGGALNDVPAGYAVRQRLKELKKAFGSHAEELLPVDDLSFNRGIYWLDLKEKYASLIGIANNSIGHRGSAGSAVDVKSLRSAPSNVIGILSGTMLAAAI